MRGNFFENRYKIACIFLKLCYNHNTIAWGYGSVGRAVRSQRTGHEFESRYLHHPKAPRKRRFLFCTVQYDFDGFKAASYFSELQFSGLFMFFEFV